MTSPRTILSAIAVAAALTIGLAPAAHAGTIDPSDAVGTASPEPNPAETDEPIVEPTDEPTDDPEPTVEPSTEPTTVAPTTVPTTQPQPTTTAPAGTTTTTTPVATSTTTTTSSVTPTSGTSTTAATTTSTTTPAVFYEHCAAVHDAGQPLLFAWEPGYRTELDPDLDGIACEWREHHGDDPDNDWRTLVVVIPVIDQSSTNYTYYGDDDLAATYTQWPTVPDGPIATGQP